MGFRMMLQEDISGAFRFVSFHASTSSHEGLPEAQNRGASCMRPKTAWQHGQAKSSLSGPPSQGACFLIIHMYQ